MLGLVDFVRAVHGTVRLALRRVHPLVGGVVVAMIWVLALGSLLWVTREDDGGPPSSDAAGTERGHDGTRSVDRDGNGDDGDGDDGGGGPEGVGEVEWAEGGDGGSPGDGSTAGEGAGGDVDAAGEDGEDPTLESPGGPGRVTPPPSTGTPPSWDPQEPEEPGPGGTGSTSSTTTPPSPGTSTTVPPSGGGLLDVVLGALFP